MSNCKELEGMHISPAKNGGYTVRHSYRAKPVMRRGAMNGGMGMDYPESEEHVFGANQGKEMLAHVSKHLGVTPAAPASDEGDE